MQSLVFDFLLRSDHGFVPSQKPPPCPLRTRFGKNVLRLRRAKKLTQEALAEAVGLSTRYTQSIEAGEYFPTLPTLAKLRKALEVSWDELFEGCGDSNSDLS